ncbi:MAG: TetR/AcrR family transcriptional regulator [Acidimicrobiales bacterium]
MPDEQHVPGSRKARAADTRRRLLEVAVRLFTERPYDDVSVAEISREAGAAHGLLFHHFDSKRGIYLAALEELAARNRSSRTNDLSSPGADGLRRLLDAHFGAIAANPQAFLKLMTAGLGTDPEAQEIFERDRWEAITAVSRHLNLDNGSPAVKIALRGAIGGIDHAVLTWLDLDKPFPLDRLIDTLVAIIAGSITGTTALDTSLEISHALEVLDDATRRKQLR